MKHRDTPKENKAKMDNDSIIDAMEIIEKHPSMRKIKGHMEPKSVFSFDYVTKEELEKEIRLLNE